jgi:hypothetical protein
MSQAALAALLNLPTSYFLAWMSAMQHGAIELWLPRIASDPE